jgi:hypothetical protein
MNDRLIAELVADAVKHGATITIGPHEVAACVVAAEKDGRKMARACDCSSEQIGLVLTKLRLIDWDQCR